MKTKHFIVTGICCLLIFINSYAQEAKLKDLQTPPSPAFVLLGIEPASITAPTTPRAVAASFISTVQQGGALEVAPYWLTSHPNLDFNNYINANVGQTILQTMSFSFASIPKTETKDTMGTRVGLGARWLWLNGNPRMDSILVIKDKLDKVLEKIVDPEYADQMEKLLIEKNELTIKMQEEQHIRVGFSLAMASAVSMNFLNDNFSYGKIDKWGAWITASYILDPSLDILAVARFIGNSKAEGTQNVLDFGGRIVISLDDFSLSCEYIQRVEQNNDRTAKFSNIKSSNFFLKNTYKLTGNVEYKYNNDFSVFLTFGKDYSSEKDDNGSLVAQVGINLGFGAIPVF